MEKFEVGDKVVKANSEKWASGEEYKLITEINFWGEEYRLSSSIGWWDEKELKLYEEVKEMKELTFKEVIANIKENEVWESAYSIVSKLENRIDIEVSGNCKSIGIGDTVKFKLRRKEYTFEEAFKAYEEGKEIESCFSKKKFRIYSWEDIFNAKEIKEKWYIND